MATKKTAAAAPAEPAEPDPLPADADAARAAFARGEIGWRDYVAAVKGR